MEKRAQILHIIGIGISMAIIKREIEPDVCTYLDPDSNILTIEIVLPGVSKENIRVKVKRDAVLVAATTDNENYAKYIHFSWPLEREMGKAVYEHEILRIMIPIHG